jgi:hypothetical protein
MSISAIYAGKGYYMSDTDAVIRDSNSRAKAFLEFKHANIQEIDLDNFQIRGLRLDADERLDPLPVFVVVYYHLDSEGNALHGHDHATSTKAKPVTADQILSGIDHRQYFVVAANLAAQALLAGQTAMLSEKQFWELHAAMLGRAEPGYAVGTSDTVPCWSPDVRFGRQLLFARRPHSSARK